jgi:hypothetical protein
MLGEPWGPVGRRAGEPGSILCLLVSIHQSLPMDLGKSVVAIVGSDSANSKGMEVWSPGGNPIKLFFFAIYFKAIS